MLALFLSQFLSLIHNIWSKILHTICVMHFNRMNDLFFFLLYGCQFHHTENKSSKCLHQFQIDMQTASALDIFTVAHQFKFKHFQMLTKASISHRKPFHPDKSK